MQVVKKKILTEYQMAELMTLVLNHYGNTSEQLFAINRGKANVASARCIIICLFYVYSGMSQNAIARFFKRNHGTINYNRRRLSNALDTKLDVYDAWIHFNEIAMQMKPLKHFKRKVAA